MKQIRLVAFPILIIVLVALVLACGGTSTPQEAVAQRLSAQSDNATPNFAREVEFSEGVLVLFDASITPASSRISYAIATSDGQNWEVAECCNVGGFERSGLRSGDAILFDSRLEGDFGTVLYGLVNDLDVTSIEATFDDGTTLSDMPVNGVFAMVAGGARNTCKLRALDSTGAILQEFDVSSSC